MAFSLKKIIDHPLMSPIIWPARAVYDFAFSAIKPSVDAFDEGFGEAILAKPSYIEALWAGWKAAFFEADVGVPEALKIVTIGGLGVGLLGGALVTGALMSHAGFPVLACLVGGTFAGVAGGVLAPIVALGAVFCVAGLVGVPLKGLPGMTQGIAEALDYAVKGPAKYAAAKTAQAQKQPSAPLPVVVVPPAPEKERPETLSVKDIDGLSPERQMEKLREIFPGAFQVADRKKVDDIAQKGVPEKRETPILPILKKKPLTGNG